MAISLTGLWLGVFVLLPHALLVATSLLTADAQSLVRLPLTLDGFRRVLTPLYASVFVQSTLLSLYATGICLLIAYPFAWVLSRLRPGVRALLLFLLILPFWTNSLIRTYAIKILLGNKGVVNSLLLATGVVDEPLQLLYTEFAVIYGLVYILLPFMVLPLYSTFEKLDLTLLEAARDLGANRWQCFAHVVLPLSAPGLVAGCLVVFLPAMGMFYVADLLGGAKNLLLGNLIKNVFLVTREWPLGAALSLLLLIIMAVLLAAYHRANRFVQRQGGLHDQNL